MPGNGVVWGTRMRLAGMLVWGKRLGILASGLLISTRVWTRDIEEIIN